jgi:hypothetical protein
VNGATDELAELFAWQAPSPLAGARRIDLLTSVGSELALALADLGARFERHARADRARATLDGLDDATLVRILGAPEVSRAVAHYHSTPDPALLDELEGWFAVEAVRGDPGATLEVPRWSALGDRRIPGPDRDATDDWGVRGALVAASCHGIVIDFDSPPARRTPPSSEHRAIRMEAPVAMAAADRRTAIDKLEAALAALAATCPPAYQLVTTLTRVIMPRQDSVHPTFYTSGSIRTTIGRTALNNPHTPGVTIAQLVSSLVHEAIHAYLYIEERARPLVTDWDRAFDTTAASPWTGTTLSLPTYLHACFVWYGLRALWRLPALVAYVGDETAHAERTKAERGFAGGITRPLDAVHTLVAPRIWTTLERIADVG